MINWKLEVEDVACSVVDIDHVLSFKEDGLSEGGRMIDGTVYLGEGPMRCETKTPTRLKY